MFTVWHPEDGAEEFATFREAYGRWHEMRVGFGQPVTLYYSDSQGRIDILPTHGWCDEQPTPTIPEASQELDETACRKQAEDIWDQYDFDKEGIEVVACGSWISNSHFGAFVMSRTVFYEDRDDNSSTGRFTITFSGQTPVAEFYH